MLELLDSYPEYIRAPLLFLVIIILGYMISKIAAAIVQSVVKSKALIKSVFWCSWLIFISIAYWQIPALQKAMVQWHVSNVNLTSVGSILLISGAVFLLRWYLRNMKFKWLKNDKWAENQFMDRLLFIGLILIVVLGIYATVNPDSLILKSLALGFMLLCALLYGKALKEFLSSFWPDKGLKTTITILVISTFMYSGIIQFVTS